MKKRTLNTINVISFVLVGLGLISIIFNKMFCKGLCSLCTNVQLNPCFFLFMFTGIIFIVDGASLYVTYNSKIFKKTKTTKKR